MTIDTKELLSYLLGPFGTLVLCLFILWTGSRGDWVFGWYAKELRARNSKLEASVDRLSGTARSVTSLAERTMEKAEANVEVTSDT